MAQFILLIVFMLLVAALVIGFVAGSAAALWRWRGGWRLVTGLPLLGVLVVVARIVVDTSADPTAHNLWPLELLGAVVVAGAALGGILLVRLIAQRWAGHARSS
jgi:hypothetical protein